MAAEQLEYHTLRSRRGLIVSEIAQDVQQMASALFQHQIISEDINDEVNELNETKKNKARLLVSEIEKTVKHDPTVFQQFLTILSEAGYVDLVKALKDEHEKITTTYQNEFIQGLVQPKEPYEHNVEDIPTLQVLPELPTADDRGRVPDPLENPPDSAEVGRDIKAATMSRGGVLPSVDSLEGQVLKILQSGEYTEAIELLSQAKTQMVNLKSVCDLDGKTLLHLACRKNSHDWFPVVRTLINKFSCDVSAVDEDRNTPLHDAYQCGNHKVVSFLLRVPSCNPDAFNKHGFTVLRMALQKDDIQATRALLATGRVDPRRGSPRGHSYLEVMEMDGILPQNINDSALQLVIKSAECIKNSNAVYPSFAFYYLLNILRVIFKNRDCISIGGIVERIKENNTPLPEEPEKIHYLLIGLSDEFDLCGQWTNEYGEFQVRTKGSRMESQPKPAPERDPDPDINNNNAWDQFTGSRMESQPEPAPERDPDPDIDNDSEADNTNENENDADITGSYQNPTFIEYQGTFPHHTRERVRSNQGRCCINCCQWRIFFSIMICLLFIVTILIGTLGGSLYDSSSLVNTTTVAQIHRPSVPLIGPYDGANTVQLTVNGTDVVPISFYTLSQCSDQDSFVSVEVNETVTVNFDSPTDKSKSLTEWYFLGNTTLTTTITTDVLPGNSTDQCIAFLVAFNDFNQFRSFILNSALGEDYSYKVCITNVNSQTEKLIFFDKSYYYLGLYSDIPTEVGTFSVHFSGSYLQYNISNLVSDCSLGSSLDSLTCEYSPNTNSLSQDACIVGFIPPTNSTRSGVRALTVMVSAKTSPYSQLIITVFFLIPFFLFAVVFIIVLLVYTYSDDD